MGKLHINVRNVICVCGNSKTNGGRARNKLNETNLAGGNTLQAISYEKGGGGGGGIRKLKVHAFFSACNYKPSVMLHSRNQYHSYWWSKRTSLLSSA